MPNSSAIATGHYPGDTGQFANQIFTAYPLFDKGNFGQPRGTFVPDVEDALVLGDLNDHFGGNYLREASFVAYARSYGYNTAASDDGLPPGEGAFLACSFWLVDAYLLLGRHDDAHALFERLIALCNDVGLLSEEYDPKLGRLVGNFPQAFSHVALANSAFNLSRQAKPVKQRAKAGSEAESQKLADAAS